MMRSITGAVLITSAAIAVAAAGCSERMGRGWDWNRMRTQARYEPYRRSRFFSDGKTMQLPPAGTVSRESGTDAAAEANPVVTTALIARGASEFHIYCAVCHGEHGDGVSIVASNMDEPKPPSLIAPPVSLLPANLIVSVVTHGVGPMPPFAAELSPADREAVVAYVKTLQSAPTTSAMDSTRLPSSLRR